MTTFTQLEAVCHSLDGYRETGDNITKFWAELQPDDQGQPYCAAGVSWIWKHAGHPFPAIDHAWGFSYTPDAVIWAKQHGLWSTSGRYAPGDTVLYDWAGDGVADHTGVVISDDGTTLHTFECNTSTDDNGNQINGGGCFFRARPHGPHVLGVLRSSTWLAAAVPPSPRRANPYPLPGVPPSIIQGASGDRVRYVQWAVAVPVDGSFGPQTLAAVRLFQGYKGLSVDGVVGSATLSKMMGVTR